MRRQHRAGVVDDHDALGGGADHAAHVGANRAADQRGLLGDGAVVHALAEARVERDRRDAELVEDSRQHHRRLAVVVVDEEPEAGVTNRLDVDRREQVLLIRGHRVEILDVAHLVEGGTPEVLAEEQVLELALGPLVDLQPFAVEEADVCAALIKRRHDHLNAGVAAPVAGGELRHRGGQLVHVAHLASGADDAAHDRTLDHAR